MIIGSSMARLPLREIVGSPKVYVTSFLRLIVVPLSVYYLFKVCGVSNIVNNINTVFIAQIKENRVGRIMRSTNTVDIVLLENSYILFHILNGHNIACFWICVVMIYTKEFDVFIVESENIADLGNLAIGIEFTECIRGIKTTQALLCGHSATRLTDTKTRTIAIMN